MGITPEYMKALQEEIRNGGHPENNKVEMKSRFTDIEKLVASAAAIANTRGGDGIMIVGLGQETGDVTSTRIRDCLGDSEKLHKAVRGAASPPFELEVREVVVDGKALMVIEIPASRERPHVLRSYGGRENLILVRKTSGQHPASRVDLDEMYAERQGGEPPVADPEELRVEVRCFEAHECNFKRENDPSVRIRFDLHLWTPNAAVFREPVASVSVEAVPEDSEFKIFAVETAGWKARNDEDSCVVRAEAGETLTQGPKVPMFHAQGFLRHPRPGPLRFTIRRNCVNRTATPIRLEATSATIAAAASRNPMGPAPRVAPNDVLKEMFSGEKFDALTWTNGKD
ncbi:MAG: ATP-binding protein [Planctomycetes bacterium]|nr:ATP-binding protein [Planctomycetota bacterium]